MANYSLDASVWWSAHRRRYNAIVLAAAGVCFVVYVSLAGRLPDAELTAFTLGVQGLLVALYLALANAAYSLGLHIEHRVRPARAERFRSVLFGAGVALTVSPFAVIVALLAWRTLLH